MAISEKSTKVEQFDAVELFAFARLAVDRGDLEDALFKLKQVLATVDPPADAIALAAMVYARLRLFDRAEKLYERYLEKHPNAVLERFQLGMTYYDGGKPVPALEAWEKVLKDQPRHPPALFYKALLLAQTGKTGDAKQMLDVLLKSAPADNLYFGRAKELLQALEAGKAPESATANIGAMLPTDAYRTDH
ncbi:MAG: tetratricopeptide repeat protein [Gammaproteobacteria bacterium]|nr:tetratricopeptide repeat protein [Gammaproteobacteria bacterium]